MQFAGAHRTGAAEVLKTELLLEIGAGAVNAVCIVIAERQRAWGCSLMLAFFVHMQWRQRRGSTDALLELQSLLRHLVPEKNERLTNAQVAIGMHTWQWRFLRMLRDTRDTTIRALPSRTTAELYCRKFYSLQYRKTVQQGIGNLVNLVGLILFLKINRAFHRSHPNRAKVRPRNCNKDNSLNNQAESFGFLKIL